MNNSNEINYMKLEKGVLYTSPLTKQIINIDNKLPNNFGVVFKYIDLNCTKKSRLETIKNKINKIIAKTRGLLNCLYYDKNKMQVFYIESTFGMPLDYVKGITGGSYRVILNYTMLKRLAEDFDGTLEMEEIRGVDVYKINLKLSANCSLLNKNVDEMTISLLKSSDKECLTITKNLLEQALTE